MKKIFTQKKRSANFKTIYRKIVPKIEKIYTDAV